MNPSDFEKLLLDAQSMSPHFFPSPGRPMPRNPDLDFPRNRLGAILPSEGAAREVAVRLIRKGYTFITFHSLDGEWLLFAG